MRKYSDIYRKIRLLEEKKGALEHKQRNKPPKIIMYFADGHTEETRDDEYAVSRYLPCVTQVYRDLYCNRKPKVDIVRIKYVDTGEIWDFVEYAQHKWTKEETEDFCRKLEEEIRETMGDYECKISGLRK